MAPWPQRLLGLRRRQLFNIYVLVGSVGIVLAVTLFTLQMTRQVDSQSRATTWLFSSLASRFLTAGPGADLQQVMQIVNEIEVPFIVTDPAGRPIFWNEPVIGIPMPDLAELLQVDPNSPRDPDIAQIMSLVHRYDRGQEPFAIIDPATRQRLGTLHYGPSMLSRRIGWMPYLELLLLAVFFLLIVWALQMKKEGEQQRLFAGMAKETAHQLGTPITSILGWLEILREKVPPDEEAMQELGRDVERLSKVSARFSQIGSRPLLDETDLTAVVESTIVYFRRRLPHLGGRVELRKEGAIRNRCQFNAELIEWVLENLIKNGIDALKDGKGTIAIQLADGPGTDVTIRVSDTGCGIPSGMRNQIFAPGFTTKSRGWGMGLALVKRIVTQYHAGRIEVAATSARGTTFQILLPGEET
jgi:signal transduction histidine kinase